MLLHITKARKLIYFIFKPIEILLLMLLLITKARKLIKRLYFFTENGGFTPDKSRGPNAPRDLSGVMPTFEVFNYN